MVYVNVTLKVLPVNASHPRITVPRLLTITFTIAASGQSILWLFVAVYVVENNPWCCDPTISLDSYLIPKDQNSLSR